VPGSVNQKDQTSMSAAIPAPSSQPRPLSPRATFADIEARIDGIIARPGDLKARAEELLELGEQVLEQWLEARGEVPRMEKKEGFRLLALHRQGARGDPTFNACRETCRELAHYYNLIKLEPAHPDREKRVRLAGMVAKHLSLFVSGKLQVAGLGEFCCAAKPLRAEGK
jgi:hypothetical protein